MNKPVSMRESGIALQTSFIITSMPVGGQETLLMNLVKRMQSSIFSPEIVCLKELGQLGEQIHKDCRIHSGFLSSKWDLRVLPRLVQHFKRQRTQAVVTVGAGDKMFWGRLAAKIARVPVIASALHSTGWPDGVGRLNRSLTSITDCFIAVAKSHGEFLVDFEKFPKSKVKVIPNGIDTHRFQFQSNAKSDVLQSLGLPTTTRLVGLVAALRPEKNHSMFLDMAKRIVDARKDVHFLLIGDGPERQAIEQKRSTLGLDHHVHLLGTRSDTPQLLSALDVFALTSLNEANPVSILEAMGCQVPVVSTNVGSISESVLEGTTGYLVESGDWQAFADRVLGLLADESIRLQFGKAGRKQVEQHASLDAMVRGYEELIAQIHLSKRPGLLTSGAPSCQRSISRPSF